MNKEELPDDTAADDVEELAQGPVDDGTEQTYRTPLPALEPYNPDDEPIRRHANARLARERVLLLLGRGFTVAQAMEQVGRKDWTYARWRERHPDFAKEADRARLRAKAKDLKHLSFIDFRRIYFDRATPLHHYQIASAFAEGDPDSITLVLAFPEAAKTSLLVDWTCYTLSSERNPNSRFCVISEGQDLSRKIINQVQTRMTDSSQYQAFIHDHGPFKDPTRDSGKPWNADYFQVAGATADEKEPSMEARGVGGALYGGRYDLMICDDIQSDRNLGDTQKLLRYLRQTVLTRPATGLGRTLVVGSRVGDGDIYATMAAEDMLDAVITIPAMTQWVDKSEHFTVVNGKTVLNPDCPAQPTWPEHWKPLALANRRRKVGEAVWARTYMQAEHAAGERTFTEAMIHGICDPTRQAGPILLGGDNIIAIDPALDSGVCAYLAANLTYEALRVTELTQRTDITRYEDLFTQLAIMAQTHRPTYVVVEQNNFQKGLLQDDRMLSLAAKYRFTVVPHMTNRNKSDPVMGVQMMASDFSEATITLPWADEASRAMFTPITSQARSWKPGLRGSQLTQDALMTLWFAWRHWQATRVTDRQPLTLTRPSWLR